MHHATKVVLAAAVTNGTVIGLHVLSHEYEIALAVALSFVTGLVVFVKTPC